MFGCRERAIDEVGAVSIFFYWAGPFFLGRAVPRKSPGPLLWFNPNYFARFSGKTRPKTVKKFGPIHSSPSRRRQ